MSRKSSSKGSRGRSSRSTPILKANKTTPYKGTDPYAEKAKREGYAARSVYKLEEIHRRFSVLKRGAKVLDLGCSPGSWARYALEQVGSRGTVVGVDINPPSVSGFNFLERSILDITTEELLAALGGPADVVLSDMAPLTTGNRLSDHVRQLELAQRAADIATEILTPGGNFIVKVFDGEDTVDFVLPVKMQYRNTKRIKPDATRKKSREFFLVCVGKK
jgi:23S rRNA (uridine2552-2'-O)-methyltransferase